MLSQVQLEPAILKEIEIIKSLTFETMIMSPRLKIVEHRGHEIVTKIFSYLVTDGGYHLLPNDWQELHQSLKDEHDKARVIADFIAGMTDRYAVEFFGRITGANPESIFKQF